MVHLGIDIGGTATRWVACDDEGVEIARGRGPGATGHLFNPAERVRLETALRAVVAGLADGGLAAQSVTAGITGFGAAVLGELQGLLVPLFSVDSGRLVVTDDIVMAYAANFAPGEGHLVSAGTGSIGVFIGAGGELVRVGGRGILIDDAGSGGWIALRALDRVFRTLDRQGSFAGCERLADQLFAAIGGVSWHDVRQFVYSADRGRIGTLAVAVARAAAEGDAVAQGVLERAGEELAELALALVARAGKRPVGLIGGALGLHPLILETVRRQLAVIDVRVLDADGALAAARLQTDRDDRWRVVLSRQSSIG
ncbi:N-acetylglucosamine kinase [Devosia submarina]|uniref:N-acetylglucosamine kinase n=1 Tax=Devosia submarina TaxID=1173082 RepID=UPI000D359EAB|nr:BadF/BadG/BcrA/BcrD ATPase family protein [Devosia submarina]